jgi:hypothetical protein
MTAKKCISTGLAVLLFIVIGSIRAQEGQPLQENVQESREEMPGDEPPAESQPQPESEPEMQQTEPPVEDAQQPVMEAEKQEQQQVPQEIEPAADVADEEAMQLVDGKAYEKAGYKLIAGPLPKVLKARDKPYVVVASIEVPPNRQTTIEPGTVLLFRNFTGLHVQGRLVSEGTKAKPIIYTSEFDTVYNELSKIEANPFDWDGIYIHDDGIGTLLTYCKIFYSVYGIRSDTKFIRIEPAQFKYNGKSNLTIMGTEHKVTRKPYSYVLSTKDATVDGVPVNLLSDPAAPRRNILRYVGLTALVSGAGVGVYEVIKLRESQDEFDDLSSTSFANLNQNSSSDWESAQKQRNKEIVYSAASIGAGVLGGFGFVMSFRF